MLLIEDSEHRGEYDLLVERLRQQGLEVTVRSRATDSSPAWPSCSPTTRCVLANVPRDEREVSFSDEQIDMLVRNTQQMGGGLVMLGGPNSFGAGGWTGTELEKAMPVDFQIHNAKVVPRGALVMLMHASEIAEGNYLQKVIAKEAIKALGAQDYCGVMHWDGNEHWIWRPRAADGRDRTATRCWRPIDRMMPGDMPDFEPAMSWPSRALPS